MKPKILRTLCAGLGLFGGVQLASGQVAIPASLAVPASAVNTNSSGFKMRIVQGNTRLQMSALLPAERLLSGKAIDPQTGEPFFNEATPNPIDNTFWYDIPDYINMHEQIPNNPEAAGGNFSITAAAPHNVPDQAEPGIPGINGSGDDFVMEFTGFLQLPAGTIRFGVNSDDGFQLTIGDQIQPSISKQQLLVLDGTRGFGNTENNFTVAQAGIYPFRLIFWERGSANSGVEFFAFAPGSTSGNRYLVNDRNQANAIRSYSEPAGNPPRFINAWPDLANYIDLAGNGSAVPPSPFMWVEILDGGSAVNLSSVVWKLDGVDLTVSTSKNGVTNQVTAQSPVLAPGSVHTNTLVFATADGTTYTNSWPFTVSNYPIIPESLAVSSVDTTKRGFKVRTMQIPQFRYPGNRGLHANAERALAGGYRDPATGEPYPNTATLDGAVDGYFIETETINYHDGGGGGSFGDDRPVPGIPGIEGGSDYYITEATAFLELKAGPYRFGVNSDDGFKANAGLDVAGPILGNFNGTRGVADTYFDVMVPADGFYPMRMMFSDAAGGGAGEWFTVDLVTGEKTLINDPNSPNAVKAYYESAASRPAITRLLPAQDYLFTHADEDIIIELTDGAIPVKDGSVTLKLNGAEQTVSATRNGKVTRVVRDSSVTNLLPSGVNNAELVYTITENGADRTITNRWSYTVPPYTTPIPPGNRVPASQVSGSGFMVRSHQIDRSGDANQGNGGRYSGNGGGGNNMPRPEIQLANGYVNLAGEPYPNLAQQGGDPDGSFLTDILNFNGGGGGNSGVLNGDLPTPGLPGTGSSQNGIDNFVQEVTTYLDLKAGAYVFGVNLDDGFVMISAPNPKDTLGTFLGRRDPGGGNANPLDSANAYAGVFNVIVPEDGIYPVRLLWWQGGGGVNLEVMTIDRDTGLEKLLNYDTSFGLYPHSQNPPTTFNVTGVTAYSTYTGPERPWVKFSVYPLSSLWQNQHQQSGPGPIIVKVAGGNPADIANESPAIRPFGDAVGAVIAGLGSGTVDMVIDGEDVNPTVTDLTDGDKLVSYMPPQPFASGSTHTAGLVYAGTTNYWTFTVITNVVVPASARVPSANADPNAKGFRIKVVQANSTQPNTMARAEAQLAGNPASVALPGTGPDGSHILDDMLNLNVTMSPGGTSAQVGNFQTARDGRTDLPVPGIPGQGLSGNARFENLSAEIFAYLDLPAGYQKFGIAADDGAKVEIAMPGQTNGLQLVTMGNRGAGPRDYPFAFITPEAGLYPVRVVWYQGGGGGNIEFFTYGPNNEKIPVNEPGNPNSVKAYYAVTGGGPGGDINITSATVSAGQITIQWTGGGTLESSPVVPGATWTSTGDSDGSFTEPATGTAKFYRVRR